MGFWEEHAAAEAKLAPPPVPTAQNAATVCATCATCSEDVLLGICSECFAGRAS